MESSEGGDGLLVAGGQNPEMADAANMKADRPANLGQP
jgi:hypothetical protein